MLTRRQAEILLDFYAAQGSILPLKSVSQKYAVSVRTIQNDLQCIRNELKGSGMELCSISSKGCLLQIREEAQSSAYIRSLLKAHQQNYYFSDASSRVKYILSALLQDDVYKKSEELADEMFISKSRLSADLASVKQTLSQYRLSLHSRPYHGLYVEGLEVDKRRCIIKEHLNFNSERTEEGADAEQGYEEINEIKEILLQAMMDSYYRISDVAFQNLIIHISTAVERIRRHRFVKMEQVSLNEEFEMELELAEHIMRACCERFQLVYSADEVILLALNLYGKREYDNEEYITAEINSLVYEGLMQIKKIYHTDLTNDLNLRISLGLHILPLLARIKTETTLKNIMTYTIKQSCPLAFDMASTFANAVLPKQGDKLSDDEVSYIALHFSYSMDQESTTEKTKSILLVNTGKKSSTILVQQKIMQWFPSVREIDIISSSMLQQKDFQSYNAVITTEPSVANKYEKIVLINYFPNESDLQKVDLALRGFSSAKDILDKFHASLFYHGKAKDKQEVIDILYQKVQAAHLADEELYRSILLHETIASSYFGNCLAILHPEKLITDTTFIAVAVLDEKIRWEEDQVNVVFLVSIEKDNLLAYKLWHYLSYLISNEAAIQALNQTPTYEHLIETVKKIYEDIFR
ncbi:PRD domain-containing protein [Amedibacillus dolichus]|uniref:PRD domain-containing protein n=1 Tax=Amedibacillus dolichus TaxID=31971 RepID=A0ABT7UCM2_9FIRM|nr:PRD domain-containing protein [Amedibacillus dolichus]MDM8157382.1 PRD domain-containing protein [Amedibacillus dolichus]